MNRIGVDEHSKITNGNLTDEMITKANAIVDRDMNGRTEVCERVCRVCDDRWFLNEFSINCTTDFDYRDYKFKIVNDDVKFINMEGNFRR